MPHQLTIEVATAELKRTTKQYGKMDVYALVQVGKKHFETKVCKEGDRNPVWDQSFQTSIDKETSLDVEVWEHSSGNHVMIADGRQALAELTKNSNRGLWINLFYQKKIAGKILLNLKWKDAVEAAPEEETKQKKPKKAKKAEEKKGHEEEQEFSKSTSELVGVQESSKPTKMITESGVGTTASRDCGIQTDSKDDKEVQVVLLMPGSKKLTKDASTQWEEVAEIAIQTNIKEDKSAQTKSWDLWEKEFILNYEKKQQQQQQQQPSLHSLRWDSVSRDTSSREIPLTYLEKRTRGSGSLPKLDVRNAKMATIQRHHPIDEDETSVKSFRGANIEEIKGRKQKFTHVGNILLKNNFATYNIYNVQ